MGSNAFNYQTQSNARVQYPWKSGWESAPGEVRFYVFLSGYMR